MCDEPRFGCGITLFSFVGSPKPNWDVQYNVGFCILNGTDPTQILQRSNSPILVRFSLLRCLSTPYGSCVRMGQSPVLDWEVYGLTPNVVFAEAWYPLGGDQVCSFPRACCCREVMLMDLISSGSS